MKNYLWLLQSPRRGYDTYDSCVVVAKNETGAKLIHPSSDSTEPVDNRYKSSDSWCRLSEVKATKIGIADDSLELNIVVIASFNAG